MSVVTQADRDAADAWKRDWEHCLGSHTALVQAFAAHRTASLSGVETLVEALEWFAGLAKYLPADMHDAEFCDQDEVVLQAGHLRRAAAALATFREGQREGR